MHCVTATPRTAAAVNFRDGRTTAEYATNIDDIPSGTTRSRQSACRLLNRRSAANTGSSAIRRYQASSSPPRTLLPWTRSASTTRLTALNATHMHRLCGLCRALQRRLVSKPFGAGCLTGCTRRHKSRSQRVIPPATPISAKPVAAYKQVVSQLQAQGFLTAAQAGTLDTLADNVHTLNGLSPIRHGR